MSGDAGPGAKVADELPVGTNPGKGPAAVGWLTIFLVAAAVLPTLLFAGAVWISASNSPDLTLSQWSNQLATFATIAFLLVLALLVAAWIALRHAQFTAERTFKDKSAQRMRAEQAEVQTQKLDALGRLTGGVVHDLNNLLMVINNNAFLLRRLAPDGAAAPRIAAIERAVETGTKLTRQLSAFSGLQAVHPQLMRLQDELPALVELMRPALGVRISVRTDVDANTSPVQVDRAALELALLNLAVNASDAMPGMGECLVTLRNAPPGEAPNVPGDLVTLSVADTGAGIPEELQARVFEPFFSTKPIGKGTGLGLSQVYGFCQQSGGTVTLESKPGKGTTVRLYLPASREPVTEKDWTPAEGTAEQLGQSVLIVEDNDEVAETTRQLLEHLGCEVKRAASGNAAVLRLERDSLDFDLVLSDIVMPGGLSGIEVMHYVRARYPHLPVVLMTGYSNELQKLSHDEIVLLKPFSPKELADALRKALEKHHAMRMGTA